MTGTQQNSSCSPISISKPLLAAPSAENKIFLCSLVSHLRGTVGLPWWLSGKEPACQCRRCRRQRFNPWVRKIPWRRAWQSTPGFLPGESHGQRSLAGYSPWGHRRVGHDLATEHRGATDPLSLHTSLCSSSVDLC